MTKKRMMRMRMIMSLKKKKKKAKRAIQLQKKAINRLPARPMENNTNKHVILRTDAT